MKSENFNRITHKLFMEGSIGISTVRKHSFEKLDIPHSPPAQLVGIYSREILARSAAKYVFKNVLEKIHMSI